MNDTKTKPTQIVVAAPALSLAERVKAKLNQASTPGPAAPGPQARPQQPGAPPAGNGKALLLDTSGSMIEDAGDGVSKIDALKVVARTVRAQNSYEFSDSCRRVAGGIFDSLYPGGGTLLGAAFAALKHDGICHVVLITDGLPQDPDTALREAQGLKLDIFYVGPEPRPAFLDALARVAQRGSSSQNATLAKAGVPQLKAKIAGLLGTGSI